MIKYRVREVAKDFDVTSKVITEILGKYGTAPKSTMQVLTDGELNIIFDYLTFHNQISSLDEVFAGAKQKTPEPPPAPPVQEVKEVKEDKEPQPQQAQGQQPPKPQQGQQGKKPQNQQPQQGQAPKPQPQQAQSRQQPQPQQGQKQPQPQQAQGERKDSSKVPQKRVIDTRGTTLNTAKYDERLDKFVPDKLANAKQGKEKFASRKDKRQPQTAASGAKRRQEQRAQMQKLQLEIAKKAPTKVEIPDEISVGELASRMKKTGAEVVRALVRNKIMASLSDVIDYETAALIAMELGCKVEHEVVVTIEEKLIDDHEDAPEELKPRSPVVVVMGHVDHGKTSLLDKIRNAHVAEGEAGGITQHIGAYQVEIGGKTITFLDTPGHEAFTSMRARGAMVTDVAILVVAADDGIMPQTIEAINHAKAADIPIVVAINKMDKPGANPQNVKQQLTNYELLPEDWGGDTICCEVSARTGEGIDNLLEMVALTAEMRELRANPDRKAKGTVIEARLDKGRGPIATVLVQNGTLRSGDILIAGMTVGRVRTMINDKGQRLTEAGPSVPVEITGLRDAPNAGDIFNVVDDERMARELVEQRKEENKQATTGGERKVSLNDLFAQIKEGELKELTLIVKADVQGSVEAVKSSLEKLSNDEVRVRVIHGAVGAINESDIMLAATSNAIIVGFNVRPDAAARESAARNGVDMRMYRVIYDCIQEIGDAMKGMLAPQFREVLTGHAEIRQTYHVSKVGTIAGCYMQDGKIVRSSGVRVVRDGIVVHEGELASLRRFKDDVKEVAEGYEFGCSIEKFNDLKEGDIIEAFVMEKIED
ncbi:MAG: translation initiation factor IF-2 [Oscillospiraceae bacterium]|nr:translation initiation factor IF-2 [Oscillospiraceae bacterium]